MLPTSHLLAFTLTTVVFIAIPGPSVLFVVSRSVVHGSAAGVATVAGNTAGVFTQIVAVAFGIGPLVERSITLFTILKLAGAAYLVFLGVQAIRHRRALADALGVQPERKTLARIMLDGFSVGVTNPKAIVFFAAILPQVVDRTAGDVPVQLILLGLMAYIGAVMTLPGIAGFVLTMGIGVDSNVLIFERIKEELEAGRPVRASVNAGFSRVFLTLMDTHLAALISAAFLFQFGTGPIRGFAITLVAGLASNLFTATFVSKTLFELELSRRAQASTLSI